MSNVNPRRWANKREAADYAGTSVRTIERWIDAGKLTGYRAGPKLVRIDLDELDAMFKPISIKNYVEPDVAEAVSKALGFGA